MAELVKVSLLLCLVLALNVSAYPMAYPVAIAFPDVGYGAPHYDKLGRVKIQVYRGPNKEKIGYDYFAPWGYYVTQPEDDKGFGYGHH